MTKIPLAMIRPEPGETKEEFVRRFRETVRAGLDSIGDEEAEKEDPGEPETPLG